MSKAFGTALVGWVAALLALASGSVAEADTRARTRVTIRGTGSNVTIDKTEITPRKGFFERRVLSAATLGEAVRLKVEGADDRAVIAYLHEHRDDLPQVIDAGDVKRLRKAGAGKSVVAYLATVAAVDIGETGEGWEPADSSAPLPDTETETPISGMPYGYPLAGGYAAPYPARRGIHGFSLRRAPFPRRQPALRRSFPLRVMPGRRRAIE